MKKISKELLNKAMDSKPLDLSEINALIEQDKALLLETGWVLPDFIASTDSEAVKTEKTKTNDAFLSKLTEEI